MMESNLIDFDKVALGFAVHGVNYNRDCAKVDNTFAIKDMNAKEIYMAVETLVREVYKALQDGPITNRAAMLYHLHNLAKQMMVEDIEAGKLVAEVILKDIEDAEDMKKAPAGVTSTEQEQMKTVN